MEIVTKEQYWIDILNDNSKFGQITTEDASFNLRANDVWKVIENSLLVTEDEEDVANWEGITQLSGEGLTIFQRKVNILYILCEKNYIPFSLVRKIVEKTTGKDDIKYELYFDKEQNKFIVHTDRADENTLEIGNSIINQILPKGVKLERYNHNMEINWQTVNKYANCTNTDDIAAINADYKTDLTSDGEWVYSLPNVSSLIYTFSGSKITKWRIPLPALTTVDHTFHEVGSLTFWSGELPMLKKATDFVRYTKIKNWTVDLPSLQQADGFIRDNNALVSFSGNVDKLQNGTRFFHGASKLTTVLSGFPSLTQGYLMFNTCILNKESVLRILASLSSFTEGSHQLTLGIHIDHQNDEEVLAAIDAATTKGWTVTTQWNGTATTSTYSLRPTQSQPIYAKYEADELGMYIDANNVRYSVNWGHMISSPDGKSPDELGYQEFASLEEALTTWGLTEIMEISEQES